MSRVAFELRSAGRIALGAAQLPKGVHKVDSRLFHSSPSPPGVAADSGLGGSVWRTLDSWPISASAIVLSGVPNALRNSSRHAEGSPTPSGSRDSGARPSPALSRGAGIIWGRSFSSVARLLSFI